MRISVKSLVFSIWIMGSSFADNDVIEIADRMLAQPIGADVAIEMLIVNDSAKVRPKTLSLLQDKRISIDQKIIIIDHLKYKLDDATAKAIIGFAKSHQNNKKVANYMAEVLPIVARGGGKSEKSVLEARLTKTENPQIYSLRDDKVKYPEAKKLLANIAQSHPDLEIRKKYIAEYVFKVRSDERKKFEQGLFTDFDKKSASEKEMLLEHLIQNSGYYADERVRKYIEENPDSPLWKKALERYSSNLGSVERVKLIKHIMESKYDKADENDRRRMLRSFREIANEEVLKFDPNKSKDDYGDADYIPASSLIDQDKIRQGWIKSSKSLEQLRDATERGSFRPELIQMSEDSKKLYGLKLKSFLDHAINNGSQEEKIDAIQTLPLIPDKKLQESYFKKIYYAEFDPKIRLDLLYTFANKEINENNRPYLESIAKNLIDSNFKDDTGLLDNALAKLFPDGSKTVKKVGPIDYEKDRQNGHIPASDSKRLSTAIMPESQDNLKALAELEKVSTTELEKKPWYYLIEEFFKAKSLDKKQRILYLIPEYDFPQELKEKMMVDFASLLPSVSQKYELNRHNIFDKDSINKFLERKLASEEISDKEKAQILGQLDTLSEKNISLLASIFERDPNLLNSEKDFGQSWLSGIDSKLKSATDPKAKAQFNNLIKKLLKNNDPNLQKQVVSLLTDEDYGKTIKSLGLTSEDIDKFYTGLSAEQKSKLVRSISEVPGVDKDKLENMINQIKDPTRRLSTVERVGDITGDDKFAKRFYGDEKYRDNAQKMCASFCALLENYQGWTDEKYWKPEASSGGGNKTSWATAVSALQVMFVDKAAKHCPGVLEKKAEKEKTSCLAEWRESIQFKLNDWGTQMRKSATDAKVNELGEIRSSPSDFKSGFSSDIYSSIFYKAIKGGIQDKDSDLIQKSTIKVIDDIRSSHLNDGEDLKTDAGGDSALQTYATTISMLHSTRTNSKTLEKMEKTFTDMKDKQTVPYNILAGSNEEATRQGSAARNPLFYYSLVLHSKEPEKYKKHLLESFDVYLENMPALIAHIGRNNTHVGKHGYAPYYFYPTVPYVTSAMNYMMNKGGLNDEQKKQLRQQQLTIMGALSKVYDEKTQMVKPLGKDMYPSSPAYSNPFAGMAMLPLLENCGQENLSKYGILNEENISISN